MAIRTDKSVFYRIPKTGSVWVKQAILFSGCKGYRRCRDSKEKQKFGLERSHSVPALVLPADKDGLFSFTFVRHPVQWYRSFWAYRMMQGWNEESGAFPPDKYMTENFEEFMDSMLSEFPDGFVTEMYGFFVDEVDFVGKQERLTKDLITALTLAGEEFDEEKLRKTKRFNRTAKRFKDMCVISHDLERRILDVEYKTIERFYA